MTPPSTIKKRYSNEPTDSKQANILDEIHDGLDSRVFDDPGSSLPNFKEVHRHWIKDLVYKTLEGAGYTHVESWLNLVFTGSLTTHQWSDESDCDISLFVNADVFPEWSRAEMIGVMVGQIDGTMLPGTPHPMQVYVVPASIKPADLYKPGLRSGYDLDSNSWIVPPEPDRVLDTEKQMRGAYVYALEQADKMERLLKFEPGKAIQFWHAIHKRRKRDMEKGRGDYTESNITYKFLFKKGLIPQIAEQSGEYIAKVAKQWQFGDSGILWNPGLPGKGLIDPEGKLHSWPVNEQDGYPNHFVWILGNNYGREQIKKFRKFFNIERDGTVTMDERSLGNGLDEAVKQDSRLRRGEDWKFTKAAEYDAPMQRQYTIDNPAVRRAAQELGLKNPVKVEVVGGTHGSHFTLPNGSHLVEIVGWLKPESANKQLWHELKHAAQIEEQGTLPQRPEAFGEYRAMPTEVEAREFAENAPYPLVHPVKTAAPKLPRVVRKWVYNGNTKELLVGVEGAEEGETLTHSQLATQIGITSEIPWECGTITPLGYVSFEYQAGMKNNPKVRYEAQEAIKREVPDFKLFLGGESKNLWGDDEWEL